MQEYGSESPPPNTRRVYIAYLDSVHFFEPKECRTAVYYEIILGYIDDFHCKRQEVLVRICSETRLLHQAYIR